MKKILILTTLILGLIAFINADVYVKQQVKTPAFMGQPEKTVFQEQWLGNNRMATISNENNMILDLNLKKIFMIQHKSKTYIEMDLPMDITKIMPEQMATMMKGMMDSMTVTVTPNGQTKKVLQWDTKGYDVTMNMMGMEIKMIFWAAIDPGFDWRSYAELFGEVYKVQMRIADKFLAEFKKIEGYPVSMETQVMGITITSNVLEINPNREAGANIYTIPAGYTKKDKLSMEELQQR